MKAQCDEGGGRLLLSDNTGGGAVMLRPGSLMCPYVKNHIYSQLDLSQSNYFVGRGVSVELELYMHV